MSKNIKYLTPICLFLILVLLTTMVSPLISGVAAADKETELISDEETLNTYEDQLYGKTKSTQNAGKIWADKTVYNNPEPGSTFRKEIDGESFVTNDPFLEVYSALGFKHHVTGVIQPGIDLAIILDISQSMAAKDNDTTRIQKAVDSVNEMIDTLMRKNENNRISLTLFSTRAYTALELGRVSTEDSGQYLSVGSYGDYNKNHEASFEIKIPGNTVVDNKEGKEATEDSLGMETNLDAALELGLNSLSTNSDTENDPRVVLLTDGESNCLHLNNWNVTSDNPTSDEKALQCSTLFYQDFNETKKDDENKGTENIVEDVENEDPDSNFIAPLIAKTLLSASYQKTLVEDHYGKKLNFAAIAVDVHPEDNYKISIKNATLEPGKYFNSQSEDTAIKEAYDLFNQCTSSDQEFMAKAGGGKRLYLSSYKNLKLDTDIEKIKSNYNYIDQFYDIGDDEIKNVFDEITEEFEEYDYSLLSQETPNDFNEVGALTYEDPIGEYMRLSQVQGLILFGKTYKIIETAGEEGKRNFVIASNGEDKKTVVNANVSDEEVSLDEIKITSEIRDDLEYLRVTIPEKLLPVIREDIIVKKDSTKEDVESFKINDQKPVRVVYSIKPVADILGSDNQIDLDKVDEAYKKEHTFNGKTEFFSNYYQQGDHGDAYVSFVPSKENPYYYNQIKRTVYTKKVSDQVNAGDILKDKTSVDDLKTYYIEDQFYMPLSEEKGILQNSTIERKGNEIKDWLDYQNGKDSTEGVVINPGKSLLGNLSQYDITKVENKTGTAPMRQGLELPEKDNYQMKLGNNAKMTAVSEKNPTLKIEKSHTVGKMEPTKETLTIAATDIITYFLTIANTGSTKVDNLVVSDEMPEGLELQKDSISDKGYMVNRTIYWQISALEPGESVTVYFSASVSNPTYHQFKNVALLTDSENSFSEQSNEVIEILEKAQFEIIKKQSLNGETPTTELLNVRAGDRVTYQIIVSNTGVSTLKNLNIVDTVESSLIIQENSITMGGTLSGRTLTWVLPELVPGKSVELNYSVVIPYDGGIWKNTAHAIEDDLDIPSNTVVVESQEPYVTIVKTQALNEGPDSDQRLTARDGDNVTYYFRVHNSGSASAQNVIVSDDIPNGLSLVENSISDGGVLSGRSVSWRLDHLDPNEERLFSFKVHVPSNNQVDFYKNTARLKHDAIESEIPSNTVEIDQPSETKVSISKSQSVGSSIPTTGTLPVAPSDVVTYYLLVSNDGDTNVESYQVSDTIEKDLIILKGSLGSEATMVGNTIVWTLTNLEAHTSRVLRFQVQIPSLAISKTWENTASLILPEEIIPSNQVEVKENLEPESFNTNISNMNQTYDSPAKTANASASRATSPGSIPETGVKTFVLIWVLVSCISLILLLTTHLFTAIKNLRK